MSFAASVNIATEAHSATSAGHCNETQATAGGPPAEDYCFISTRLTFAKKQTKKTLVVKLLDDDVAEGQEFFRLMLTEADGCFVLPTDDHTDDYTVWITDYEDCTLSIRGLSH